jgi:hypothetical protein
MGGHAPARETAEDPALNPVTGLPYDAMPFCDGPTRPLRAGQRIELNEGDYVSARGVARWSGSYRCALHTVYEAGAALAIDVRMTDTPTLTCQGPAGGVLIAPAAVSLQLTAADGTLLQDGPCSSATVSVWPGDTNLELICSQVEMELRAGMVRVTPTKPQMQESLIYFAECHAARGD